jgi:integrase
MILTFARTTEPRAARWSEIENLEGNEPLWRIPAARMKMRQEHIAPLAPQAVAALRELRALPGSAASPFLFPSPLPRRIHEQQYNGTLHRPRLQSNGLNCS